MTVAVRFSLLSVAGLESMKRLQSLSVDHNQLISTRGLREVCTLLRLDFSYNHLTSVEGLDSCALLSSLDLRANNLTEVETTSWQKEDRILLSIKSPNPGYFFDHKCGI